MLLFQKCSNKLSGFFKNEEGTAAIEFAMIAPLMVATYFGTVEVSKLYITKNKVETVAETITDLVAQSTTITTDELADIFRIATNTLSTEEDLEFNIVVTAVDTQPNGAGEPISRVVWSESKKGTKKHEQHGVIHNLPEGLARNYETVIMTELYYDHTSVTKYFFKEDKSFDRVFYSKPRYTASIPCEDCS